MSLMLTMCYQNYFNSWFVAEVVLLVPGVVTTLLLAWHFMRERKDLSPAKVLGVNLVLMQLLYLSMAPLGMVIYWVNTVQRNSTEGNRDWKSGPGTTLIDVASVLNLVGCPGLLACMCIERYTAVAMPMLYLRSRKWVYKITISAAVWANTLIFVIVVVRIGMTDIIIVINFIICFLFLVMLTCLVGVAWSLCQASPAHSTAQRLASPLKRRALRSVLAVLLPTVCSYLPFFGFIPIMMSMDVSETWCNFLRLTLFCPMFSIFIGPMFYLAQAQQILCVRKGGQHPPHPGIDRGA
ncbi:unnamed protein product [Merluccius merluccius]